MNEFLCLLDFKERNVQSDEFTSMVCKWDVFSDYDETKTLDDIVKYDNHIWECGEIRYMLFYDDNYVKKGMLKLISLFQDEAFLNKNILFKRKMLMIIFQLVRASVINKVRVYSSQLVDAILGNIEKKHDEIIYKISCCLMLEFVELGYDSVQFKRFQSVIQSDQEIMRKLQNIFTDGNYLYNSLVFDSFNQELIMRGLTLKSTTSSFMVSCWVRLSSLCWYKPGDQDHEGYRIFELLHPNGSLFVSYTIDNGELILKTSTEEHSFECFQFQLDKLYNISIAHVCEGKKMTRIDVFLDGNLIQPKVVQNIFNQAISGSFFLPSNLSLDLIVSGPPHSHQVMEISNIYVVESDKYRDWVTCFYALGPNYSGSFADSDVSRFVNSNTLCQSERNIPTNPETSLYNISRLDSKELTLVFNSASTSNSEIVYYVKVEGKLKQLCFKNDAVFIKRGKSILNSLDACGGYIWCLTLVANASTAACLIQALEFLFELLSYYKYFETRFTRSCGYEILAVLLKSKRKFLNTNILELVLKYTGYNDSNPDQSYIRHTVAYKTLILDFDIWQSTSNIQNDNMNQFLLYQISVFSQESQYSAYNRNKLKEMKTAKKVLLNLKKGTFGQILLDTISNTLMIEAKYNHSNEFVRLLLEHVIYSLNREQSSKYQFELGGAVILKIVKSLIESNNKINGALSTKFLFTALQGPSDMREIALDILLNYITSNVSIYLAFVKQGGFYITLYSLRNDFANYKILNKLYGATFGLDFLENEIYTLSELAARTHTKEVRSVKNTYYFTLLTNLMRFGANSMISEDVIRDYVNMLFILKKNDEFTAKFLMNTELINSILFVATTLKKNESSLLEKFLEFLTRLLIDELYTDNEQTLIMMEKMYHDSPNEFSLIMIPLILRKMKTFEHLMNLLFANLNKATRLAKLLIKYLQNKIDVEIDKLEYLQSMENVVLVIPRLTQASESFSALIPIAQILTKEYVKSYLLMFRYYLENLGNLNKDHQSEILKIFGRMFMSNPEILLKNLDSKGFCLLIACFMKLLKLNTSLAANCIRIMLLEVHPTELLKTLDVDPEYDGTLYDLFCCVVNIDDTEVFQKFSDETVHRFFEKVYENEFGTMGWDNFTKRKTSFEEYVDSRLKMEKSAKFIENNIETYSKLIYQKEFKIVNSFIQDDIDDFSYYMNMFVNLMANISSTDMQKHKALSFIEGKNRKRNKVVDVLSNDNYAIFDITDIQKTTSSTENFSILNDDLEDFNFVDSIIVTNDDFDENRTRRVVRNLFVNDRVSDIYNVTQIVGLDPIESILVLGSTHIYIVEGYFYSKNGEICCDYEAPEEERDEIVKILRTVSLRDNVDTNKSLKHLRIHKSRSWPLSTLVAVSKRKFLLRDVSFELFFKDGLSILLSCGDTSKREKLFNKLSRIVGGKLIDKSFEEALKLSSQQKIKSITNKENLSSFMESLAVSDVSKSEITKKWRNREISNFQYLILLNTISGRTFNDFTQYPVFPFVLSDYSSSTIDLSDPSVYRDFSKPMGAQSPGREQQFRDRFEATQEMSQDTPPFHYGTHYSSAMIVTSYMIRMHPFTDSFLKLQGGKFDHPARLFHSINKLWTSASSDNTTDVRELIPEFYYFPEFLTNSNKFKFGNLQDGTPVDDVELPPWSDGDPIKFVRIMREALESDYASEHLPEWIDLVFGYKQQGPEAINATNVFHYLSYPGSVDLTKVMDEHERAVMISIIHNFGQTPVQIFRKKHPLRNKEVKLGSNLKYNFQVGFKNVRTNVEKNTYKVEKFELDEENSVWFGVPPNTWVYKNLKIEKVGINSLLINGNIFEELVKDGEITSVCILSASRFSIGCNNGLIRILELTNDPYKYVLNSQRGLIKLEQNKGKPRAKYVLLELEDFYGGHYGNVIKQKFLKNDQVLITLERAGDHLSVWNTGRGIHLMCQLNSSDESIIDFDVYEDDSLVVGLTGEHLYIWRYNGELIRQVSIDINHSNRHWVRICENHSGNDFMRGLLLLVDDGVYYLDEAFELERIAALPVGEHVGDVRFGFSFERGFRVVYCVGNEIIMVE